MASVSLDDVAAKMEAGQPLTESDLDALEGGRNIITMGALADAVRRKLHGTEVTFVRVCDVTLEVGPEEEAGPKGPALRTAGGTDRRPGPFGPGDIPPGTGEIRLFQTPETLSGAVSTVERLREAAATTPFSAFCLYELSKLPEELPTVLRAVKQAGLEFLTQAPLDKLKAPEQALQAVADAGLRLSRLTLNNTPDRKWTDVCREVAAHQRRVALLRAFAPLPREIDRTQPTTGYADVKRIAIARMLIQNVDMIQVDWALYGPKLAQVALTFGADDIDSVAAYDDETHGHRRSTVEEIRRSIQAASMTPVERNGRFERI